MPYTDRRRRPEILVHPDIVGGPASWRTEPADVDQDSIPPAPAEPRAPGGDTMNEETTSGGIE